MIANYNMFEQFYKLVAATVTGYLYTSLCVKGTTLRHKYFIKLITKISSIFWSEKAVNT